MATQADLDRAYAWAKAQVGKPYVLGTFGNTFDCSTYMSGIATMIRDGVAKQWFTTHPFHSGAKEPLHGWVRDLEAPFMIGITADGIGHTGGTLLGTEFEATAAGNRVVRMGDIARGARDPYYTYVYGFRPSLLDGNENGSGTAPFYVNSTSPSARPLQAELKRTGFLDPSVEPADNYGPMTQAAVAKFHMKYTEFADGPDDVQINATGWEFLKKLPDLVPATYTVQDGDTLSTITALYGVDANTISSLNALIKVGQDLIVSEPPTVEAYVAVAGDTWSSIADSHGITVDELMTLNNIKVAPGSSYIVKKNVPVLPEVPTTGGKISPRDVTFNRTTTETGKNFAEGVIRDTLVLMGLPVTDDWVNGYLTMALRESSYNPNAINTYDSNAINPEGYSNASDGYPFQCSRGMWQCIPQTFAGHHQDGTSLSIYDPIASCAASINYVRSRYNVADDGSNLTEKVQQADPTRPPKGY